MRKRRKVSTASLTCPRCGHTIGFKKTDTTVTVSCKVCNVSVPCQRLPIYNKLDYFAKFVDVNRGAGPI